MLPKGWESLFLGDVFSFKNGLNGEKSLYGAGAKFVNVMDVFRGPRLRHREIVGEMAVSPKQLTEFAVRQGDVLFNRTSETDDEIALSTVYLDTVPAVFGGFVIRARPSGKALDQEFCVYSFQAASIRREMIRRGQGAIRSNIGQADLATVPMLLPPLPEQRRIAEILSTWDRAIETVEALIANARAQKKALMQSLLTGKNRLPGFSGAWGTVAIGEVAGEVSERGLDHADYPVLSCSKYVGMVESLKYFKKKVYSDDTSNYKVMRRGTFGFPSNHVEEGSIGYQNICDVGIVSPIYCVFRATDVIVDGFLYKLLKTDRYRQIFAAATNASVDRRGSLRWKEFAKIKIPLPPHNEQRAISNLIDTAELKVEGLDAQLKALRQEKSALMQQLLTGKRRVLVDEMEFA